VEVTHSSWTPEEKEAAQKAMDLAYQREVTALIATLQHRVEQAESPNDVWSLHDFLSAKRHEMDGKFDLRDSSLIFMFATLVKDGLLHVGELEGFEKEKLVKISALARF
jgi:hypothetical protein